MSPDHGGEVGQWGRGYTPFSQSAKRFRRKRVLMGNAIIESLKTQLSDVEAAKKADRGLYCKNCRKWIRWTDLLVNYEQVKGFVTSRRWSCPKCCDDLREDDLGET